MNKMIDAIERRIFAEVSVICYEHIIKHPRNAALKLQMIDDYLQHGKLQDKTVKKIMECLK